MKVSKNWLNMYVPIMDIDTSVIAEKMPLIGNEIESVYKLCNATNLVVGKVLEKVKHPDSDKLNICKVDIGSSIEQIVCGAKNVDVNQKVIVARIGATLPGGITINPVKLRGVESNGMICSLEELGIESKYVPERSKGGIHILDDDAPVGEDAIKYLCYDDEVLDVELTANRSDLLSMLGMAYEIGAVYNRKVVLPNTEYKKAKEKTQDNLSLSVQTVNCPLYIARQVRDVTLRESPNFMKARLMAAGIRPINNVVDISNYVMLEYGQPLHFFDSDKLGDKIIVRMAEDKEKMTTLDGIERILDDKDIVIANDKEVVALAGVMGGLSTEVTSETKNITIESAVFNPLSVRRTSKEILRSEASIRYEKGLDTERTMEALNRACYLLQRYANATILDGEVMHNEVNKVSRVIKITLEKINRILGMALTKEQVLNILVRLGFSGEEHDGTFMVMVPSRRLDVTIEEDLIEEIGRMHGYNNMKGTLPTSTIKKGGISNKYKYQKEISSILRSLGLNQVITYTLTNNDDIYKFTNDKFNYIELNSPLSEDKKIIRYSLIPSLLKTLEYNMSRNISDIRIFENSNIYYKENSEYIEKTFISGALTGEYITNNWQNEKVKIDFFLVKGIIETLLNKLKLNNRYEFKKGNIPEEFHPGRSAEIILDGDIIGYIGQVHPNINKNEIYVFELFLDKIIDKKIRPIKFKEISKYPEITKDMAFIFDKNEEASNIIKEIKKQGGKLLTEIDIFDIYTGENVGDNEKSIAFKLKFQDENKTLTDDEVMEIFNKIIKYIEVKFNAKLRNK